jgi:hypothetical protein
VPGLNGPASCFAAQAASYGVARAIRKPTAMYDLTILHGASLKAVGQAKENSEKNQAVAEEMVRVNVDAVFESACRFIVNLFRISIESDDRGGRRFRTREYFV